VQHLFADLSIFYTEKPPKYLSVGIQSTSDIEDKISGYTLYVLQLCVQNYWSNEHDEWKQAFIYTQLFSFCEHASVSELLKKTLFVKCFH